MSSVGKHEEKMGLHGSPTAEIVFTDCIVPKENLLGQEGKGFKIAMQTLDGGRIGIAAQALGIAEGAMEEAMAYTKGRVQFGKPISKFQNTQFTFADMAMRSEAGRLLTYQAAVLKGEGKRFTKEAAMAKLFCSEHAMMTTTKALQMFGGYGYTKDQRNPACGHLRQYRPVRGGRTNYEDHCLRQAGPRYLRQGGGEPGWHPEPCLHADHHQPR